MEAVFGPDGYLPPGVHTYAWCKFETVFGWNSRRRLLLAGLRRALTALRTAGCKVAYIDGSFVTTKENPGDYDACWEARGVDLTKLDPILLTFDPGRHAQKAKYLGELFPADSTADLKSGARFIEFFQTNRDGIAKGIARIELLDLP